MALRIVPLEGSGEFDPKLATLTTNLIVRDLKNGNSTANLKYGNGKPPRQEATPSGAESTKADSVEPNDDNRP